MRSDRPSATATLIAKSQLLMAQSPHLADCHSEREIQLYHAFLHAALGDAWQPSTLQRIVLRSIERLSVPGIYLHHTLRKRYIQAVAHELLESGRISQVVVIAAGFDPLLTILSEIYPSATFIELDHPATQAPKRSALTNAQNISLIPLDFTTGSLPASLKNSFFSAEKPTLFIAEGITMYLDSARIDALLHDITHITRHPESRFLFTYMEKQPCGSIQFESATLFTNLWLRLKNERFTWGIESHSLADFLLRRGLTLLERCDTSTLAATHLTPASSHRIAKGEYIALASIGICP